MPLKMVEKIYHSSFLFLFRYFHFSSLLSIYVFTCVWTWTVSIGHFIIVKVYEYRQFRFNTHSHADFELWNIQSFITIHTQHAYIQMILALVEYLLSSYLSNQYCTHSARGRVCISNEANIEILCEGK